MFQHPSMEVPQIISTLVDNSATMDTGTKEAGQSLRSIIILKNFEFHPSKAVVNPGDQLIIQVQNNRRQYSDVYDNRAFVLAVELLEIESPPLKYQDSWSFSIEQPGKYELVCLNYCKLSLKIEVSQPCCSIPVQIVQQIKKQSSNTEAIQQPKDNFQAFTYEEFQSLICAEEISKFSEIPKYLLRCFKTQLNLLQNTRVEQRQEQTPKQFANYRQHSTNTQECSVYQQFDQSRMGGSPGKGKALTIFEDEERTGFQSRSLKKTSSQVIALQWKQETVTVPEVKKLGPSKTLDQQAARYLRGKFNKPLIPKPSAYNYNYNHVLAVLSNRVKILELIG